MDNESELQRLKARLAQLEQEQLEQKIERLEQMNERLEQRLKQKNEQLKQKNEQLKQKKEQLKQKNEHLKQKNERLERDKDPYQDTTLNQYLDNCHNLLFASLTVRPNIVDTSVTKVEGKYYPSSLSAWGDFTRLQQDQFEILEGALKDERLFLPYTGVRMMQRYACETPVANEDDMVHFEHITVEKPVADIIRALCAKADSNSTVAALHTSRIFFANHSLSIHIPTGEVIRSNTIESSEKQGHDPSPTKRVAVEPKEIRPDRRCLRQDTEGNRAIAFIVEYKAAHKLQTNQVRRGLNEDLFLRVIKYQRGTKSSTDNDQARQDRSDNMLAMVLIQTFDYMIRLGLEYSYLTAGNLFIFLHIKADDRRTLYYHLADPDTQAEDQDGELKLSKTAVAQVAGFSLLALRSNRHPAKWTSDAQAKLYQWPIPYSEREHETTDDDGSSQTFSHSSDLSFTGEDIGGPKQKLARRSRSGCKDPEVVRKDDADGADNANDDTNLPNHGKDNELNTKQKDASSSSSSVEETSDGMEYSRQYCTMDCLLGLKRGQELDAKCPNVASHRKAIGDVLHPISFNDLANLMQRQLASSLERDCEPLEMRGKYGAVGTLFRLSLTQYGYTFVGKGTIQQFVPHLEHEAKVYRQLEKLQGEVIPVYIGSIDLMKPYHLTARDAVRFAGHEIVHMLLMSWAGEVAVKAAKGINVEVETAKTLNLVRKEKVFHDDVREPNLLWNEERQRVMVIDFHTAKLLASKLARRKRNRTSGHGDAQSPKRVKSHRTEHDIKLSVNDN
jgi:hypothetical protein